MICSVLVPPSTSILPNSLFHASFDCFRVFSKSHPDNSVLRLFLAPSILTMEIPTFRRIISFFSVSNLNIPLMLLPLTELELLANLSLLIISNSETGFENSATKYTLLSDPEISLSFISKDP